MKMKAMTENHFLFCALLCACVAGCDRAGAPAALPPPVSISSATNEAVHLDPAAEAPTNPPPGFTIVCDQFGHFAPAFDQQIWNGVDHTNKQAAIAHAWRVVSRGDHTNRTPGSEWKDCQADGAAPPLGPVPDDLVSVFKTGAIWGASELMHDLLNLGEIGDHGLCLTSEDLQHLKATMTTNLADRAWSRHPMAKAR